MTSANPHHERRWLILALLGVAQLMVILDATIVNIALPSAQADLGFGDDERQWIITAYALAFGSLLLLGGRLSDLLGRKWMFIGGLVGFAGASALGGAAQSFEVLVGARALQGVFGAMLAPASLALLTDTFTDPGERAKATGVYGAIAGGGGAIGLLLGGVLTEWASWRWCLYVNLGFALPAALAALSLLHHVPVPAKPRLDIPGVITASAGIFALVYGFSTAETDGWDASITLGSFAAATLLLGAFVALQRRVADPLLPLRVVGDRNRGGAYLAVALAGAGMFGVFLFLTYYLQQTLGFSPVETGLAFLPMIAAIMITATTANARVVPRTGPRPLVPTGMVFAAAALVWFTFLEVDSSYAGGVLPGLIVMGIGFGLVIAPAISSATLGVASGEAGIASAMVNTSQQVGGSVGTALLSTIAATATSNFITGRPTPAVLAEAAVHGYTTAFWWAAAIFATGAVITALVLPSGVRAADPRGAPTMAH